MPKATITSKGQITIPAKVRKALMLKPGDQIDFQETGEGRYAFRPIAGTVEDLKGLFSNLGLKPLGYVPTPEEMNGAVGDYLGRLDAETHGKGLPQRRSPSGRARRTA